MEVEIPGFSGLETEDRTGETREGLKGGFRDGGVEMPAKEGASQVGQPGG